MPQTANRITMSRRTFLQRGGLLTTMTSAALFAAACNPVRPALVASSSTPAQETENFMPTSTSVAASPDAAKQSRARVAFVKTSDRAEGVRQAIRLLGASSLAKQRILLKPNFNSADPAPGSTHPTLLRTLVEELWSQQASAITVADRSGMGDTRRVMEQVGLFDLAKTLDFEAVVLDELAKGDWELMQHADQHWQQGFLVPNHLLAADAVVQTCCLKTHRYGGHFTLSLKNSVGLVAKSRPGASYNYMNELHSSPQQRYLIAEINAAYAPALIVLDGVEAFTTGGPDNGKRVAANVVLAGTDRIAIDAVGVALLRHHGTTAEVSQGKIFAQQQLARAVELGLGITGPEQIELVTADAESEAYAAQIRQLLDIG